jgi:PAS domain S-box-containing protein
VTDVAVNTLVPRRGPSPSPKFYGRRGVMEPGDTSWPIDGLVDYEDLFNQAPVGHIIAASDGSILALNDTVEDWTGVSRAELLGTPCYRRFPEDDYDQLMARLSTAGRASGVVVELLGSDGRRRPVAISATRGAGRDGRVELDHIVISEPVVDVVDGWREKTIQAEVPAPEVVRAEQEIRRNEALLRAVLDTVGVGVSVVDADGRPLLHNAEFAAIIRHAAPYIDDEVDEADLLVFESDGTTPLPPERRLLPRLSEGESFSEELIWIGPAGHRRALSINGRSTRNDAFEGSVTAFDDVTQLATALIAKDEFVGAVSHELRTPLTSIMGYLELALDDENLPPHLHRPLETAMRNSERLLQLVTDLLSVASGTEEPDKQEVDLTEVISARIQAIAPRAEARHIQIAQDCAERLPVNIDPKGIARMLDNLLSNAVKFSQPGGPVTVQAFRSEQDVVINVIDAGIGMSEEEQRTIFSRFFRAPKVIKAAVPGAGLGLGIAKAIIEAHDGELTVTSSPGDGSTFTVTLPDIR